MLATGALDWRWRRACNTMGQDEAQVGAELTSRTAEAARCEADALLHEGDRDGREAAAGAGLSKVAWGCLDRGAPPLRGAFPVGGAWSETAPALPWVDGLLLSQFVS